LISIKKGCKMKSTKLLKLITFLGTSLFSINKVYAGLPECSFNTKRAETTDTYCTKDNKIFKTGIALGEGCYYFNSSHAEIKFTEASINIAYGYECKKNSSDNIVCEEIKADLKKIKSEDGIYVNSYYESGELKYQIIKKSEKIAYLNKNVSGTLANSVILCDDEECKIKKEPKDGDMYLDKKNGNTFIKCTTNKGCTEYEYTQNEATYFLDAANIGKLIECKKDSSSIKCNGNTEKASSYFINGANSKSVIYCNSEKTCDTYTPSDNSFFINGDTESDKKLISCYGKSCIPQEAVSNGYYLTINHGDDSNDDSFSVITCTETEENVNCTKNNKEIKGFLRNADENTSTTYPLIECRSINDCSSLKLGQDILPGYYVDVTLGTPKILVCTENSCTEDDDGTYKYTEGRGYVDGNYLFDEEKKELKLVIDSTADEEDNKLSAIATSNNYADELYYYFEASPSKGFPGVTINVTTLYKVSQYYIARVITNGVVYVDDTSNKITESGTPGTDSSIYICSKSKKTCSISKSCTSDTYILDVINGIGYQCTSKGTVQQITEDGYFIDSSNGTVKRPVIHCVNKVCTSISSSNYYVNSGSDGTSNPLVYCNGTTCRTTTASNGYYLSGVKDDSGNVGIIKCSSSSNCDFITPSAIKKTEHYYLNNGNNKNQKALIKCKGRTCSTTAASDGYFITNDSSTLILCENAISCSTVSASAGFYNAAVTIDTGKKIIECTALATINCELKDASVGYYVAKTNNILINCNVTPCKAITVTNGIYRSATTQIISSKRDTIPDEDEVSNDKRATTAVVYNIISCTPSGCNELTTSELLSIPVCTFTNNKCFINNRVTISTSTVSAISAGSYCTNSDRSVLYFATDTVVIDPYIIDGTTSIYTYTTTTTNCIEALDKYSENYYTVGSSVYKVSEISITQVIASGYYFINVDSNSLVGGNNIENYNDENVKLFKCNDSSCSIIDKPETITYYADVNKRIIQYNPNSDSYTFAYDSDVICIYSNNKCTPRSDIKSKEFCITYKGELALVANDIKSRETGECYKADTINSKIYGLSQYMYKMNSNSAERIIDTAYYVVSLSTNSTATLRDFDGRNNSVRIYGCVESKCSIVDPADGVYYYDSISNYMFRYSNSKWVSPQASGYALVSVDPNDTYVNRFTLNNNVTTIEGRVKTGYYFTIDKDMYECDHDKYQCDKIDNNGYYFTISGEVYQCVYDSEGLEATECTKKNCIVGQYYYINSKYYYCGSGYILNLVTDKTCEHDDRVIINYPVAFSEQYPDKIKNAVESISTINNSTALVTNINSKYISSVSGVFTNCTYTVEEKDSEFDLVCINNYVSVNEETDNVEICSLTHMGYVECVEDENNPEKCNPSGSISRYAKGLTLMVSLMAALLYLFI